MGATFAEKARLFERAKIRKNLPVVEASSDGPKRTASVKLVHQNVLLEQALEPESTSATGVEIHDDLANRRTA